MAGVAVVTDSTADIPPDMAEKRGLRVVPMTVTVGDESFISGVTLLTEAFYERLENSEAQPQTSQPTPAWFEEAYQDAADAGAEAVVSVHLSAELSGTYDLATRIARDAPLPVTVVDARQTAGGLALAVFAALRSALAGAPAEEVAAAARRVASQTGLFFVVDDLDYLRRGGRLGGAQALIGSVLRVKPVLTIEDGTVQPVEKVRTWRRAIERLAELAAGNSEQAAQDVIVTHGLAPQRASEVWRALDERAEWRNRLETIIGPVLASHTGPGAVGVAVAPRED